MNYGMRPNEVIREMELLAEAYPIMCNLWGNHESFVG